VHGHTWLSDSQKLLASITGSVITTQSRTVSSAPANTCCVGSVWCVGSGLTVASWVDVWSGFYSWGMLLQPRVLLCIPCAGDGGDITFKGTTISSGPAVRVQSFDGPGILGVNVQLRPAQQGQAPPDYWWPAAAAAGLVSSDAGLSVGQVVGIVMGSVCGVLLLLAAVAAAWHRRRRRSHEHSALLPQKPPMDTAPVGSMASSLSKTSQHSKSAAAQLDRLNTADVDTVGTEAVNIDTSTMHDRLPPLPKAAGAANGSVATSGSARAGSLPSGAATSSASSDSISQGLDRWRAAISTTTMQLMERRMQLVQGSPSCSSTTASIRTPSGVSSRLSRTQAGAGGQRELSASGTAAPQQSTGLQIHHLIGQGSFGSVWLGECVRIPLWVCSP